ncbi:MAG: pyridoxal phosphate-dependent decarboxylase family protein [Gemmatimonadota bacterium]
MIDDVWRRVVEEIRSFPAEIRDLPVSRVAAPSELRTRLARYDLESPVPIEELVDGVCRLMRTYAVHVVHPRYFGLFNPSVRGAGIIGDTLAALYNPQLAAWSHAPAAQELERLVLARFADALGFDPATTASNFTTGGAEANLSAVLAAVARRYPDAGRSGLAGVRARPAIYLSDAAHHSFVKIARMTGVGTDALRPVRTTERFAVDIDDLRRRIASDLELGYEPLLVVGTAGTTATGAIDPLPELAAAAREFGAWFHVDAAWGGSAVLSHRLRPALDGIDRADSVTWDAHKWLSVPMGAGMFFCRHPDAVGRAFSTETAYMPAETRDADDPYRTTAQWSRRAIGLKVFLSVAELGLPGYGELIERQAEMGDRLRARLTDAGWDIVNDTPLPLVCFTHPRIRRAALTAEDLAARVNRRGRAWISHVVPAGDRPAVLRACVTSYRTDEADLDCLVSELEAARRDEASAANVRQARGGG